jgi:DNA primase
MIDKRSYILKKLPDGKISGSDNISCRCPFHNDSRPSFSISLETGLFICRSASCGLKGGFNKFYKLMEGIPWSRVKEELNTADLNIDLLDFVLEKDKTLKKKKVHVINDFPNEPHVIDIPDKNEYMSSRGLGKEIIEQFGLRFGLYGTFDNLSIANSIVVPIFELDGSYQTYQLRYLGGGEQRWVNPSNSSIHDLLYNGWNNFSKGYCWVVEGASDVWNLTRLGQQAIGLFTKKCSSAQYNRLLTLVEFYEIIPIVCMDGDATKAGETLYSDLIASGVDCRIVYLEKDEDPGMLSAERLNSLTEVLECLST